MTGLCGHLTLPFGAFYGMVDQRHHAPGLEIALLNADPHRAVARHSHDEAHFVFVLSGLYVSSAAGAQPVSAGQALIFNPAGTTHRDRFEADERGISGQFLTLSIAADLMAAADHELPMPQRAQVVTRPSALALAAELAMLHKPGCTDTTLRRESLALALLEEVAAAAPKPIGGAPSWLGIARERLDDALGSEIRTAEIAGAAGVHPVHLARVFRQCTGMTPGAYLRRRRLESARTLLRQTQRPIADIALACGFADQSHFATAFRRHFRTTPRGYRQG